MTRAFGIFLLILITFSACEMKSPLLTPSLPLADEGEVFVYLDPLPREAERLKFSVEALSALGNDGREYPLTAVFTELGTKEVKRQRLFARGLLPAGSYNGFSMKITRASLKGEEGEAALLVPDNSVRMDFSFTTQRNRALVISWSFQYRESLKEGMVFSPSFSIFMPATPLLNLTGYVTNRDSQSITVFDKRSGRTAAVMRTGSGPSGIVVDQVANKAYVAISNEDAVDVIDMLSNNINYRISLNSGDRPNGLALTPDARLILSANTGSNSVSIIDPARLSEVGRVRVGNKPVSILMDRSGRRAFVFNSLSNTISVIDIAKGALTVTISTDTGPLWGQFNRRGDRLYVIYDRTPYLTVFDALSLSITKKIFVGIGTASLKVDTNTDFLYLGRKNSDIVDVYDPFSFMPGDFIRAGGGVEYMTIDRENNNLCMVVPQKKAVVIVNLVGKNIVAEFDVGEGAYWLAMTGER